MAEETQAEPPKTSDSKKHPPTYKHPLAQFALATSYITIIPLSRFIKIEGEPAVLGDDEILAGLSKYLPTVGALIGLPLCVLALLLGLGESTANKSLLNAVILAIVWLALTGGLHFDGLMDTADGIFSHRSKERMLEIMQDSRVGNFGAISGMCTFVLKVAAMAAMSPQALPLALFLTPIWARFAEVYAIAHYPYARPQGKGKVWHDTTKVPGDVLLALILPMVLTIFTGIIVSESAYVTAIFASFAGLTTGAYLNTRLGGHTGDTYGAVVEVSETLTLVGMALLGSHIFR